MKQFDDIKRNLSDTIKVSESSILDFKVEIKSSSAMAKSLIESLENDMLVNSEYIQALNAMIEDIRTLGAKFVELQDTLRHDFDMKTRLLSSIKNYVSDDQTLFN